MKIKIFDPKSVEEPTLFLKLEPSINDDTVYLTLTDAQGKMLPKGNILLIDLYNGRPSVSRMSDVNKTLGFELDEDGRVKIK